MAWRGKAVVWTLNNPGLSDDEMEQRLRQPRMQVDAYCFQREVGANGTEHLQGCCVAAGSFGLRRWKQTIDERAHIEKMRGTYAESIAYCSKADTRMEGHETRMWPDLADWPEEKEQGKRSDLDGCAAILQEGKGMYECLMAHPGTVVRYFRGLSQVQTLYRRRNRPVAREIKVYWLAGESGVGKSYAASHAFDVFFRRTSLHRQWWDGYDGEEVVVWDDLDDGQVPVADFLEICDGYRSELPYKGGFIPAAYRVVLITSNTRLEAAFAVDPKGNPVPAIRHRACVRRVTKSYWCESREEVAAAIEEITE